MPTGQRVDPYGSYNFLVEIDGITRAAFQEASGFESAIDIVEHREGGDNTTLRKIPAMTKYTNITLKWGLTDDRELYDWHRQWVTGDPNAQRKDGSIILLDRQGLEKMRWNFFDAWPSKWTGPPLSTDKSEMAIVTMELVHEGVVLA